MLLTQLIKLAQEQKIEIIVPIVENDDLFKEVQAYNKSKDKDAAVKLQVGTHINDLQKSMFKMALKVSYVNEN